jgi:hypothetical protein
LCIWRGFPAPFLFVCDATIQMFGDDVVEDLDVGESTIAEVFLT